LQIQETDLNHEEQERHNVVESLLIDNEARLQQSKMT